MIDRALDTIFVHCSASPRGRPDRAEDIERWHVERWGIAGKGSGYHAIVELDGGVRWMRGPERAGIHVGRWNPHSLGVCYIGGVEEDVFTPADTRTPDQIKAIDEVCYTWLERFGHLKIRGHNEVAARACPSYDVQADLRERGFWEHRPISARLDPNDPRHLPRVGRSTLAGRAWRSVRRALGLAPALERIGAR